MIFYTIFCKWHRSEQSFELKDEDASGLGNLVLRCHYCNNYAIFVGNNTVQEKFRNGYFVHIPKKVMKQKPIFSFFNPLDDRYVSHFLLS